MPGTKSKILAKILATRRLPPNVEARLDRDYQATLNSDDRVYASAEIIAAADGYDGILCCSTEKFSADVISTLPESVKIAPVASSDLLAPGREDLGDAESDDNCERN